MITHFRRRGSTLQHYNGSGRIVGCSTRLTDWAADPKTTIAQLHVALEEVLKNEPNPDWDIVCGQSWISGTDAGTMEQPMPPLPQQELEGEWTFPVGDMALFAAMIDHLESARRFILREPERSRRVLRLLCASYLAHAEAREPPPRNPAVWAKFAYYTSTTRSQRAKSTFRSTPSVRTRRRVRGRYPAEAGGLAGHNPRCQASTRN